MPEIVIYAVQGRSTEQKQGLLRDVTDAVVKNFGVEPQMVTVQIVECPPEMKSKGGVPYSERLPGAAKKA